MDCTYINKLIRQSIQYYTDTKVFSFPVSKLINSYGHCWREGERRNKKWLTKLGKWPHFFWYPVVCVEVYKKTCVLFYLYESSCFSTQKWKFDIATRCTSLGLKLAKKRPRFWGEKWTLSGSSPKCLGFGDTIERKKTISFWRLMHLCKWIHVYWWDWKAECLISPTFSIDSLNPF